MEQWKHIFTQMRLSWIVTSLSAHHLQCSLWLNPKKNCSILIFNLKNMQKIEFDAVYFNKCFRSYYNRSIISLPCYHEYNILLKHRLSQHKRNRMGPTPNRARYKAHSFQNVNGLAKKRGWDFKCLIGYSKNVFPKELNSEISCRIARRLKIVLAHCQFSFCSEGLFPPTKLYNKIRFYGPQKRTFRKGLSKQKQKVAKKVSAFMKSIDINIEHLSDQFTNLKV